jgi:hypothetical protein
MADPTDQQDYYSLPEQRERLRVTFGGISAWHVVHDTTIPSSKQPGRYTRRAWDSRALCGSLSHCVVGGDAAEWPEVQPRLGLDRVTCRRCRERAGHIARGGTP